MTKGETLARWCGVSHRVGRALCYWILTVTGTLIYCTTVQPVTGEELRKPDVREQIHNFKLKLNESLKITSEIASEPTKVPYERVLWDIDDEVTEGDADSFHEEFPEPYEPEAAMPEADDYTPEAVDQYLTANVCY